MIKKLFISSSITSKKNKKNTFLTRISKAVVGRKKINEELLDEIENILISSDVGVETSLKIIHSLEKKAAKERYFTAEDIIELIQEQITAILNKSDSSKEHFLNSFTTDKTPYVILIVGVNGVGKTTTIGKMAHLLTKKGHKVLIGACDTFRYAALEQLESWATRADSDLVGFTEKEKDPSSVAFKSIEKAKKENYNVVILDTAGRLHTKKNLMGQLEKIQRVIKKMAPEAPHDVLLILDATMGQNAKTQVKEFLQTTHLTGLVITKLDGTSKGGAVIHIADEYNLPIRFIGVGEKMNDIEIFQAHTFVERLFQKN